MSTKRKPTSRERRLATAMRKLVAEYQRRFAVGAQMSNVLFNLEQRKENAAHSWTMKRLQREWDAIPCDDAIAAVRLVRAP